MNWLLLDKHENSTNRSCLRHYGITIDGDEQRIAEGGGIQFGIDNFGSRLLLVQ